MANRDGVGLHLLHRDPAIESNGPGRYRVEGRITADFPGGTADLQWDFTLVGNHIRLVIAP